MVTGGEVVGLVLMMAINTVIAAIGTRFCRLAGSTVPRSAIGIVTVIPVLLLASTLLLSGAFGLGIDVGDPVLAVVLAISWPLLLGVTIDYVWVASPEEVEAAVED